MNMALAEQKIYTVEDIYNLPDGQRAELIDGNLYNMAPPTRQHQQIILYLARKISIISMKRKVAVKSIWLRLQSF